MKDCPCREELLEKINESSFAVFDIALYLDTHPCDEEALKCYREYCRERDEWMRQYEEKYGPLVIACGKDCCGKEWKWLEQPWPWQKGGC